MKKLSFRPALLLNFYFFSIDFLKFKKKKKKKKKPTTLNSPTLIHESTPHTPLCLCRWSSSLFFLMPSVCEVVFYLCLRMKNGSQPTRCWKLVSLEAGASGATAQGCVFNYRVPRKPSWLPQVTSFLGLRARPWLFPWRQWPRVCHAGSKLPLWLGLGSLKTWRLLTILLMSPSSPLPVHGNPGSSGQDSPSGPAALNGP